MCVQGAGVSWTTTALAPPLNLCLCRPQRRKRAALAINLKVSAYGCRQLVHWSHCLDHEQRIFLDPSMFCVLMKSIWSLSANLTKIQRRCQNCCHSTDSGSLHTHDWVEIDYWKLLSCASANISQRYIRHSLVQLERFRPAVVWITLVPGKCVGVAIIGISVYLESSFHTGWSKEVLQVRKKVLWSPCASLYLSRDFSSL